MSLEKLKKKINLPKKASNNTLNNFRNKLNIDKPKNFKKNSLSINQAVTNQPYEPDILDLYNLYNFIILNKRTTILEFGSGWSSLVMSIALYENKIKFNEDIKKLRRNNPFELFIIDNEKKFLKISKNRINNFSKNNKIDTKIHWHHSEIEMTTYMGRICTQYKTLPICNPDFIYIDAPDQFNIKGSINGFNINHHDLMPMICDIMKIEFFLLPGTIIIIDGRGANAVFMRNYLSRNWIYCYLTESDQHIFYLDEYPIGNLNKKQLEFYNR